MSWHYRFGKSPRTERRIPAGILPGLSCTRSPSTKNTQPPSFLVPQEYPGDPSSLEEILPALKYEEKPVSRSGSYESVYRDDEGYSASVFGMKPGREHFVRIVAGIRLSQSVEKCGRTISRETT